MINDFKKDHFYSLFEELPLIKNISYEMDTGNYILLDNKGNNYICDVFGRQKPIFKKNISGFINGEQRKILKRVKSHSNIINSNYMKNHLDTKPKEDSKCYFPSINRFEGYTHFPRPLCQPFTNIPDYSISQNYKKIIINECENKLDVNENKKIFSKSNENNGLSYISSDLKSYINKEKELENNTNINYLNKKTIDDKLFLIKMIDNTVNEYKIKYRCGLKELLNKHSIIRSLLDFKKKIINNNETNIINGRILKNPNKSMINEYKIIHNHLFNNRQRNILKKQHQRLIKCYSQLHMYSKILNKNNENNENNENKNMYGRKILKKISFNKSSSINNGNQSISAINNIEEETTNVNSKELFFNLNKNNINLYKIILKKNKNIYEEQETKESLETKPNNNNLLNVIRNNTNESNKEDKDNLSIISILNEKEKNKFINFNKKIKFLKNLTKINEKERKRLEGFHKEEPKKIKIMNMNEDELPKYRDFGEIYKKEQETLEKLNPILFNLQKKKDDSEMKKLVQKKHFKKLNENVVMKGKKLKIKKPSPQ